MGIAVSVGEEFGQCLFVDAFASTRLGAPFFMDNLAFGINFLSFQRDETAPVMEYQETGIYQSFTLGRYVGEVINRLVKGGIGIDVGTEADTILLQILNQPFSREMLGAIESHVFQEVGQSALIFFLQDRTNPLHNVELGLPNRLFVRTNIIGQSVGQCAIPHCCVHGKGLGKGKEREEKEC